MTYRIEISPIAVADIEAIFLWIKEDSEDRAFRWVRGCYEIMLTLESFPGRCALALESTLMGVEIRQLLYQKRYRILFTVKQAETSNEGIVRIHRVLHGSRRRLNEIDLLLDEE